MASGHAANSAETPRRQKRQPKVDIDAPKEARRWRRRRRARLLGRRAAEMPAAVTSAASGGALKAGVAAEVGLVGAGVGCRNLKRQKYGASHRPVLHASRHAA